MAYKRYEYKFRPLKRFTAAIWLTALMLPLALAASGIAATLGPVYIAANEDDGYQTGTSGGTVIDFDSVIVFKNIFGSNQSGGFRFRNISIPQGSKITSATFSPWCSSATFDDLYATIYGHDADDSLNFSESPHIASTAERPRTSANLPISQDGISPGYKSYSVTSIVQEIVDRPGWRSGNALSLLMIGDIGTPTKETRFHDFQDTDNHPAYLTIDYIAPSPSIVYTDSAAADIVRYQNYDGSWGGENNGPDTNDSGALQWHVAATSPNGSEQAVVAMGTGGAPKHIYVSLYDLQWWDDGSGPAYGDAKDLGALTNQSTPCFAAAYEQKSGELLVVSGNTTSGQIQYWVWNGLGWLVDGSTYSVGGFSGVVQYAAVAAQPNSNQIALIIKSEGEVSALIWDGDTNSWGNDKDLASFFDWAPVNSIAVAYSQTGPNAGQAVFVWAEDGDVDAVNDDVYSWTWDGSAWEGSKKTVWNQVTTYYMEFLRLAADPNSDDLLLGMGFEDQNIYTVPWDGSGWGTRRTAAGTVYPYRRGWDIIFETGSGHTGHGLLVYSQFSDDDLHYKHTRDITGDWDSEKTINSHDLHWLEMMRDQGGTLHAAGIEDNGASDLLVAYSWDNAAWINEGTLESSIDSSVAFQKPFALLPRPAVQNNFDPLIAYSNSSPDDIIRSRRYAGSWGPKVDTWDTNNSHPMFYRAKTRSDGNEQIILATSWTGNNLFGSIFDGATWINKGFGDIGDADEYRFDAAYESSSNQLLVVSGTGTSGQIKYWVWYGGSWIVDGDTFATTNLSAMIKGIEMSSRPGTNQIALIAVDGNNDAVGLIWDGDNGSWGNEQLLTTATGENINEPIQVEYMLTGDNAGTALFVWSETNKIKSRIWTGGAWETATHAAALSVTPLNLRMAADPASDDAVITYYDTSQDIHTIDWSGSGWGTDRLIDTEGYSTEWAGRPYDIVFEATDGHAGHAVIVYSDTGGLRYRHTSNIAGAWGSENTILSDSNGYIWIEMARGGDGTIYMAGEQYDSGSGTSNYLAAYTWDTVSWKGEGIIDSDLDYEGNRSMFAVTAKNTPDSTPTPTPGEDETPEWLDSAWPYRKKITIDSDKVFGAGSHINFPVLVSFTDGDLADTSNGGQVGQSDGGDIMFTSADGTTQLKHEIEDYLNTSGALKAWVKIPSLSASVDTEIYIYYGNADADDQWDPPNVWNSGYEAVYHLNDDLNDSSGNDYHGTNHSTTDSPGAKIADGQQFTAGSSQYIDGIGTWNTGDHITLDTWVKFDSLSEQMLITKSDAFNDNHWVLRCVDWGPNWVADAQLTIGGSLRRVTATLDALAVDTWYHFAVTYDGGKMRLFLDGVQKDTLSYAGTLDTGSQVIALGRRPSELYLDGVLDEARISSVARSGDWILTQVGNINNQGTGTGKFIEEVGDEQTGTPLPDYIKSIETVTVTVSSGSTKAAASLTKGQTIANCVPFATLKADSGTDDNARYLSPDIYFEAGPQVAVERGNTLGEITLNITVIEFESAHVRVQQGTYSLAGDDAGGDYQYADEDIGTAVDSAHTALVHYYRIPDNGDDNYDDISVSGKFTDDDTLRFERDGDECDVEGHYYVFEALKNQFSVQALSFLLMGTSAEVVINPVPMNQSFVIASYRVAHTDNKPDRACLTVHLNSSSRIGANRDADWDGNARVIAYVVTLNGNELVQRGAFSYADTDGTESATLSIPVDESISMAWNPVTNHAPGEMILDNTTSVDRAAGFQYLELINSGATIQGTRDHTDGAATSRWEVISFAGGARVYYSVGTDTTDLKTGAPTLAISNGKATFSTDQATNIGVGDEITYNGGSRAYISGRSSAVEYTVTTATGAVPNDVSGATVNAIKRVFNSLEDAAANAGDPGHLNTTDLVAAGIQLNLACYNDGADTSSSSIFEDTWETGPYNYIRVFTPVHAYQVGASQRHTGVAGTGYRIAPSSATQAGYSIIYLKTEYARIEGIEIDGSGLTNAEYTRGVAVMGGMSNVGDIRVDSCIIHDLETNAGTLTWEGTFGIFDLQQAVDNGPPMRVSNNIIYNISNNIAWGHTGGILIGSRTTSYVYSNTIYKVHNDSGAAWGVLAKAWPLATGDATVVVKNNYVGDITSDIDSVHDCYNTKEQGVLVQSYNVSSDTTASGTGSKTSKTDYTNYFNNITAGSEDLHLKNNSNALWSGYGADLDGDPSLVVGDDIDGSPRDATQPDIGADEYAAAQTQLHYRWRHDNGNESTTTYETITVDSISTASATSGTQTTFPHTSAGANRLMLVSISISLDNEGPPLVSGVTYNGTGLSYETSTGSLNRSYSYLYSLTAPDTGTHDVVVSFNSALSSTRNVIVSAITFNGVDQTTSVGATTQYAAYSSNPSLDIAAASSRLIYVFATGRDLALTANTVGGIELYNQSAGDWGQAAGAIKAGRNDPAMTMDWTTGSDAYYSMAGTAIIPAAAGTSGASFMAAEDAKISINKEWPTRLRFLVSNQGSIDAAAATYQLQVSETTDCDSGIYSNVGGSSGAGADWDMQDTVFWTNGTASVNVTNGLTDPAGSSFVAGTLQDTGDTSGSITLLKDQFTEVEYSIEATSSATSGGDYCFRLYNTAGPGPLDTYSVYAEARVVASMSSLNQIHSRWRNDDGPEGSIFDTGDGADGALSPSGTFNLNSSTSGARSYADGIAYRIDASTCTGNSVTRYSGADNLSNGIAAGDKVLLINLQGAGGDAADVGNYEFLGVQSVSASTITFTSSITRSYDGDAHTNQKVVVQRVPNYTSVTLDGTDSLTASAWDGLATTPSGTAGYYTGIVVLRCQGTVSVGSGTSIDVDALGYRGGSGAAMAGGTNGESYNGSVGSGGDDTTNGANGGNAGTDGGGSSSNYLDESPAGTRGGGGGGGNCDGDVKYDGAGGGAGGGYGGGGGGGGAGGDDGADGGGGGSGGDTGVNAGGGAGSINNVQGGAGGDAGSAGGGTYPGAAGSGSTTGEGGGGGDPSWTGTAAGGGGGGGRYGTAALTTIFHGSGGGGGGAHDYDPSTGETGGDGGGIVIINADAVTVSGDITSNGTAGSGSSQRQGAAGGGSGGSILIQANTVTLGTSLVTATGGSGGAAGTGIPAEVGGGGGGGSGGVGRIRVEAPSRSGSTSPSASESSTPGGTGASWAAAQDATLSNLDKDTVKRLRFEVLNDGNTSSGLVSYQLQVAQTSTCSTGTYGAVPTGSTGHWKIVDSAYLNDGAATTNVDPGLSDAGSGFIAGQVKDTGNTTGSYALGNDKFTEIEFALMVTDNAVYGASYCFRLYDSASGGPLDAYGSYARAQILDGLFMYRKPVTINSSNIGASCSADLASFPMLISIESDGDLRSTSYGGHVQNENGYDIVFRWDDGTCTGGTPCKSLDHEIESYDATTGQLVAYVRIPTLDYDENTHIYLFYGNTGVTAATENPNGVWDNNYVAVWHLKESGGGTADEYRDSTQYGNHGQGGGGTSSLVPVQWSGTKIVGDAQDFDGSNDYIDCGTGADLNLTGNLTIQAWLRLEEARATGAAAGIATKSGPNPQYMLYQDHTADNQVGLSIDNRAWALASGTATDTWYHFVGVYDGANALLYRNGTKIVGDSITGTLASSGVSVEIGRTTDDPFMGVVDEVRISKIARPQCWIETEYNNQASPGTFITVGQEESGHPTAVTLLGFKAEGQGPDVKITWETGQEINNKGFHLYRADSPGGSFSKLNSGLIPAASVSGEGRSYHVLDPTAVFGKIYYYKLEDIDINGTVTTHGPICVDWDGDRMPDDWEIAHGLNPQLDDSLFDNDNDGLSNLDEYKHGTDPNNPDTDGDGIWDGAEVKEQHFDENGRISPIAGVDILAEDEAGITLELTTSGFDFEEWVVGSQAYERLTIHEYIHGYTEEAGWPLLPVKGVLVNLPIDKQVSLTVLGADTSPHDGYQVYPVPTHEMLENGTLREVFFYNQEAYGSDAFYPQAAAELSDSYVYRDSLKQKVVFHPVSFNPVTGDLTLRSRIRIRVDFIDSVDPETGSQAGSYIPTPWMPPAASYSGGGIASLWSSPDSGPSYKIMVEDEGIYRITRDWLTSQGLSPDEVDDLDLSAASMFYLGEQIAIDVYDANADGTLDDSDYIQFYGKPVSSTFSKYAKSNVYWLSGVGPAARMDMVDGSPALADPAESHRFTVRHERDELYLLSGHGADDIDRWVFSSVAYGDGISHADAGKYRDFTFDVPAVAGDMRGDLIVQMYSPYKGEHSAAVQLNGIDIGTTTWTAISYHTATFENVDLVSGSNMVSIACTSGADKIVFDWFIVSYDRAFAADYDTLRFTHESGYQFSSTNFSSAEMLAFDITDNTQVKRITNATVNGTDPYSFTFEPPDDATRRSYFITTEDQVLTPHSLQASKPHSLTEGDADWIVITHKDLGWDEYGDQLPWLEDLIAHRQAQGLRAVAIDVNHVYDAFSFGLVSPQGIKDFIRYAYQHWQAPAPKYILLVGDASYDLKDNWGVGTVTYVPAYLRFTAFLGETASDQWYAQVAGQDALPDISIGRLPAKSTAEAEAMANKIISYEQAENDKSWQKAVLLVADNKVENFESIFETTSEDAAIHVPGGMDIPTRFYLQEYKQELLSTEDLTSDLIAAVNTGALVLNYTGHAGYASLASELIFDNRGPRFREDVSLLTNLDRYPFVVSMSCLSGYFLYPEPWSSMYNYNYHSLAEALIRPGDHGAVAALMPTGMSTAEGQHVFNAALFEEFFTNDNRIIGDAILKARLTLLANSNAGYQQINDTFLLFGDPATRLKLPLPERPEGISVFRNSDGSTEIKWNEASDCNGGDVAGYNIYRRASGQKDYIKINTGLVAGLDFTDRAPAAELSHGTTTDQSLHYYAVTSVDEDGDESAQSVASAPAAGNAAFKNITNLSDVVSSASQGGCFIQTANSETKPNKDYLLFALILGLAAALRLARFKIGNNWRAEL